MALLPIFHKSLLNPYALQYDNKSEMYISFHGKYQHYGRCIWCQTTQTSCQAETEVNTNIDYFGGSVIFFLANMVTMTRNTHHIEKRCEIIFEDLFEKAHNGFCFIFGWIIPLNSVLNNYHLMIGIQIRCKWRSESDLLQVKGPAPDGWLTLHAFLCFQGAIHSLWDVNLQI